MPPEDHENPTLRKNHRDVLAAIRKVPCLEELLAKAEPLDETPAELPDETNDHYRYALDLETVVYGRSYHGKRAGPYVQLLSYAPESTIIQQGEAADNYFYIVVDGYVEVFIEPTAQSAPKDETLTVGKLFGIKSMLAGVPRLATIKVPAGRKAQVLKISRPAVRLLRKLPAFSDAIEADYREHGRTLAINDLIEATGIGTALDLSQREQLEKDLQEVCEFKVFSKGHRLFAADVPIDRLFIVLDGWVRRRRRDASRKLRDYVGKGYALGLEGACDETPYPYTATVAGPTEVLEIDLVKLKEKESLKAVLIAALVEQRFASPSIEEKAATQAPQVQEEIIRAQKALINSGVVDGNNLLVMDMKLCVRCGNCSTACQRVHGYSRLRRRGIHVTRIEPRKPQARQSLLAPAVCMHCKAPECLTGCPTGAIARHKGGLIDINQQACIGCGDCATQCPYDAIAMIPRGESHKADGQRKPFREWLTVAPAPLPPSFDSIDDPLAIKCNLCAGTDLNPENNGTPVYSTPVYSCELNCPTGALARVNPEEYFTEIRQTQNPQTPAPVPVSGRNIHKADPPRRWIHLISTGVIIGLCALMLTGLFRVGYGPRVIGGLNLRWLTGLVGLLCILIAMAYQWRRRVYKKRCQPLRYWMLVHAYAGVGAGLMIWLHAGTFSGGLLTRLLTLAFTLVIFTGLLGILLYRYVPRLMTQIEGAPLLIEDLQTRREELKTELEEMTRSPSAPLRQLVKETIPRLDGWRLWLRHYLKREDLDTLLAAMRKKFQPPPPELASHERQTFAKAVEKAATLSRVKALISLHALLKIWLVTHLACTCFMLALLLVHIGQALYGAW